MHRAIWGYALEYSLGADDVVYSKSLNIFDYSAYYKFCPMDCPGYETGSFNVNEYGVYRFDIAEPVSIVKNSRRWSSYRCQIFIRLQEMSLKATRINILWKRIHNIVI